MSAIAKRTTILIKDLLFQEKHALTHTQTDLMAYLVNVSYWATSVEGYHVISTSKIMSDLPCLGEKTLEASLKVLKELGLIQCKVVKVIKWKGKPYLRGIRLTEKGKEYNNKLVLPTQDEKLRSVEKALKEALEKITILENQEEAKEEKKSINIKIVEHKETPYAPKKEKIDKFIEENIKYFGMTSKPICNFVPTFNKETIFFINSYNKLSIVMPNKENKQVKNPQSIYAFWEWLYLNPQRIGDKIDFSKKPTVTALKRRFVNRTIKIGGQERIIVDLVAVESGVKVKVKEDNGEEKFIISSETQTDMIFELENCQKVILEILSS